MNEDIRKAAKFIIQQLGNQIDALGDRIEDVISELTNSQEEDREDDEDLSREFDDVGEDQIGDPILDEPETYEGTRKASTEKPKEELPEAKPVKKKKRSFFGKKKVD